ncbi:hypothetical protein [Bowmanella yangjiangensis]|uniref:Uncharacterized protein n=1 Tax=Bowmanella yangjiangensis TaxID=2811230 RepID=A0ABS3CQE4_9ALTE|nr:hypothetical protein [Bowmanella yangjiangensis]MBN7819323.1 hypothetical protein [Bowmanella yangjiangensis]
MFYLFFQALRYLLITGIVLAYIEVGPGGAAVREIVDMFKEELLKVDWLTLFYEFKTKVVEVATTAINSWFG